MNVKRALVGATMMLAATFGAVSQSQAITVQEFDSPKVTSDQRGAVIKGVVNGIYAYYQKTGQKDKAVCLYNLYNTPPASPNAAPPLINKIVIELYKAREDDPSKYKVEDIIYGVIEHECTPSTDTATGAPQPATPGPG